MLPKKTKLLSPIQRANRELYERKKAEGYVFEAQCQAAFLRPENVSKEFTPDPPSVVFVRGIRIYMFKTEADRDRFVSQYARNHARAA